MGKRRVRRVSGMPGGVTMWVDHRRDVVYIDSTEITATDARLLENALATGAVTVRDLVAAYAR